MRWIMLFAYWLSFSLQGLADPILIGLHCQSNYLRAGIHVHSGNYEVYAEDKLLFTIQTGQHTDITAVSGKVNVFFAGKNYPGNKKLHFKATGPSEFKAQPAGQKPGHRVYEGELLAFSINGHLQLVNKVDIEDYVSGVIEAESGTGRELEYYKVQAVISRTYALNNRQRHVAEGYEICDATHCQVYHGKPRHEPLAAKAAAATENIVIVDHQINLITAAFHSNCGGHTVNAEEAWSKPVPYLIGRPDTFCVKMPNHYWEKRIPKDKWNSYLKQKRSGGDLAMAGHGGIIGECNPLFCHDSTLYIPLRTMRTDLKLRSTHFDVSHMGDDVIFKGRGFGHGVGLCQEGAIRMAQLGHPYEDIIHFYYCDVHLVPRHMMWFFQD